MRKDVWRISNGVRMKTFILAGGLGTRLRSVVLDRPKAMAAVSGKPFLEYQIVRLCQFGLTDLVLCIGYLGSHIQDYFRDGARWNVHIDYAVERELLGTAGAILNARAFMGATFVVVNGDSYCEADLGRLIAFHREGTIGDKRYLGTIAGVEVEDAGSYGRLEYEPEGRLIGFAEKAGAGPGRINAGMYVLEPAVLDFIPRGRSVSIEREVFPNLLKQGYLLFCCPVNGFFVDIGTAAGYHRFCQYSEENQR
jgi:mannose-1-phosphate guanylyltransferase